jgi:hypothetical protein
MAWISLSLDWLDDSSTSSVSAVSMLTSNFARVVLLARHLRAQDLLGMELADVESNLFRILVKHEIWDRFGWPWPYDSLEWFGMRRLMCLNLIHCLTKRLARLQGQASVPLT